MSVNLIKLNILRKREDRVIIIGMEYMNIKK